MRMIDRKPKASGNASASRLDGLPNHHSTTQAPFAPEVTPDPFGGVGRRELHLPRLDLELAVKRARDRELAVDRSAANPPASEA